MNEQLKTIIQWVIVTVLVGLIVGSLAAFFLVSLDWVTTIREDDFLFVLLLPLGGFLIGLSYYRLEHGVEGGNNRLISEMIHPKQKLHWKMTPLVLFGTLATHLFGGSAGREGTAVQMGGATADQFSKWWKWGEKERSVLLRMGVAAGFSGVFGTPFAGMIFAFELARDRKVNTIFILPVIFVSFLADFICHAWQVDHTIYQITEVPTITWSVSFWVVIVAILFGLTALLFNYLKVFLGRIFTKYIKYPPFRPMIGGAVLVGIVYLLGTTKYLGLGVPIIQESFLSESDSSTFLLKLLLTAFTLGAGFKGGEATPLFFMGATLGSALFGFVPLPLSLLAGLGFIAVFAGSTNTPIACSIMGIEMFGIAAFPYYIIVCFIAYFISGRTSAYATQVEKLRKYSIVQRIMNK